MTDADAAREWAIVHRDDYATRPTAGPLADAFLAGIARERERIGRMIESGRWCRLADHMQGACDCAEMAAAIRTPPE